MKKYMLILTIIGLLIVLFGAAYLLVRHQIFLQQRHHLLCEELKPGVSKDEVLNVLNQAGTFTVNEAEWLGGLIELDINFTDPKGREQYGAFDLGFSDYKYDRAYISGFERESIEVICDFSQATPSVTGTSKP